MCIKVEFYQPLKKKKWYFEFGNTGLIRLEKSTYLIEYLYSSLCLLNSDLRLLGLGMIYVGTISWQVIVLVSIQEQGKIYRLKWRPSYAL